MEQDGRSAAMWHVYDYKEGDLHLCMISIIGILLRAEKSINLITIPLFTEKESISLVQDSSNYNSKHLSLTTSILA